MVVSRLRRYSGGQCGARCEIQKTAGSASTTASAAFEGALALHAAGKKKVKPDGAGVVRLHNEGNGKARDAGRHEALPKKAEDGDHRKTHDEAGGVARGQKQSAVNERMKISAPLNRGADIRA